jgi:hypothetical protein
MVFTNEFIYLVLLLKYAQNNNIKVKTFYYYSIERCFKSTTSTFALHIIIYKP